MDDPMCGIPHSRDDSNEGQMEAAVEELGSMFGHQVTREEMIEMLHANNNDLNSSISALIQRGYRQLPDRRYESRQGDYIGIQYDLPDAYCYESALVFGKCTCERLPVKRLIKEWHIEIVKKRGTDKRKQNVVLSDARPRNVSQCSADSAVTNSMDSHDIGESSQDLSEDSQDIITDYCDMEMESDYENTSSTSAPRQQTSGNSGDCPQEDVLPLEIPPLILKANSTTDFKCVADKPVSSSRGDPIPKLPKEREREYNFSIPPVSSCSAVYSGPSLAFLVQSKRETPSPSFLPQPLPSHESTGHSLSNLAQSYLENATTDSKCIVDKPVFSSSNIPIPKLPKEKEREYNFSIPPVSSCSAVYSGPSLAFLIQSKEETPSPSFLPQPLPSHESTGPSLSTLAQSYLENTNPGLSSLAQSHQKSTDPGQSLQAHSHLGQSGHSLPTVLPSALKNSGPSLSSLVESNLGSTGPSLSSLAESNLGDLGPSLNSFTSQESIRPSLPSFAQSSQISSGPSLASLAQSNLGDSGPSNSSLAQSSQASVGPSLASLAQSNLGNTGTSLSSLALSNLEGNGPIMSNLAQSSLENNGPSLDSLAQYNVRDSGPSLSSLAQSNLESSIPGLSSLAQSNQTSSGPSLASLAQCNLGDTTYPQLKTIGDSVSKPLDFKIPLLIGSPKSDNQFCGSGVITTHQFLNKNGTGKMLHNNSEESAPGVPIDLRDALSTRLLSGKNEIDLPSLASLKVSCEEPLMHHSSPRQSFSSQSNIALQDFPSSPHLPLGLKTPPGLSIPPGLNHPPGLRVPPGLKAPPGLSLPPGLNPPPGLKACPGQNLPSELNLFPGLNVLPAPNLDLAHGLKTPQRLEVEPLPKALSDSRGSQIMEAENAQSEPELLKIQDEEDITEEIDLQAALVKHPEKKAEIDTDIEESYSVFIDPVKIKCDTSLFKTSPSPFGEVMIRKPRLCTVKRLAEKNFSVPFEIFKFDTPSPDELVRKALEDHKNPDWYRLVTRERQSRR
ncbi:serine-rich adhesin for platelets isoform X1 [Penaeus vannamei]|uniref:serine-rich adhesin for platelets isoform X1 n=2 Tax=Penaeus vannamei TaxID=6689 RepID=UPI00387F5853